MPKATPIDRLYQRYGSVDSVAILGAGPNLLRELRKNPPAHNSLVIALNSAFVAYSQYDVHLVANREFLALYGDDLTMRGIVIKPNSFGPIGYQEEFFYYPAHMEREFSRIHEPNNSLLASKSCLIPALNFALRLGAKQTILMYGIDMTNGRHWDDGKHENASLARFTGRRLVCHHVGLLARLFPSTEIICLNRQSLLVKQRILQPCRRSLTWV